MNKLFIDKYLKSDVSDINVYPHQYVYYNIFRILAAFPTSSKRRFKYLSCHQQINFTT
jgi:hypothetical protein